MKTKKINLPSGTRFLEFPDLLFGEANHGNCFNATHYLEKKGDKEKHSVNDFCLQFSFWINVFSDHYSVPIDEMVFQESDSTNVLMDESLAILFAAYVDENFAVHLVTRIEEMFISGFVLSDTALVSIVKSRFQKFDIVREMADNEEKQL